MQECQYTNIPAILSALKACTRTKDVHTGSKIHAAIGASVVTNVFVGNTLVDMYAKCGCMVEARRVFDRLETRTVVSWNVILMGYAHNGQGGLALELFSRMQTEDRLLPNARTFVAACKAVCCLEGGEEKLKTGKALHAQVSMTEHERNVFVASALVDMYAKCGSMRHAYSVFESVRDRSVVPWNTIISGYVQNGEEEVALEVFAHRKRFGVLADARTYVAALDACSSMAGKDKRNSARCLESGRVIHSKAAEDGFEMDIFVANSLVDMYCKCQSLIDARKVFERIQHPTTVSWNTMIMGHVQCGEPKLALELFTGAMQREHEPDARTFVALLTACTGISTKEKPEGRVVTSENARAVCSMLYRRGLESHIFVATALVDSHGSCGRLDDAWRVFDGAAEKTVALWNALVAGYAEVDQERTFQLLRSMQGEGIVPDARTFVAALKACCNRNTSEYLERGVAIHSELAKRGYESNCFVAGVLVDMYAKAGNMSEACRVFNKAEERSPALWNSLIMGYIQLGQEDATIDKLEKMLAEGCQPDARTFVALLKACGGMADKEQGKLVQGKVMKLNCLDKCRELHRQARDLGHEADVFVANTLVDLYSKCGSVSEARLVFDGIPRKTVVSWNAMIAGYVQCEESNMAVELFSSMSACSEQLPDVLTYISVLQACGGLGDLATGKLVHKQARDAGLESDKLINSLIDFYGKCGSLHEAEQVFEDFPEKDLVTWNALMAGYSYQGEAARVFTLFERMKMERVRPDGITFLLLLSACSHAGLIDRGLELFNEMSGEHTGLTPGVEHYTCMVDMFGRANHLDEAVQVIKSMPCQPDLTTWRSLLGNCRKWNNVRVGELAFRSLVDLEGGHEAARYVEMANIYAEAISPL